jgi:hypothetical protein
MTSENKSMRPLLAVFFAKRQQGDTEFHYGYAFLSNVLKSSIIVPLSGC